MSRRCPHDGTELQHKTYEAAIEVDACSACGGMWLDEGELEAIQDARQNDYRKALEKRVNTVAQGAAEARQLQGDAIACVVCGKTLDKREYGYGSQIVIDTCPDGCGIWLDSGEIQALEKFFERSQADASDLIPLRWRLWATVLGVFGGKKKNEPS